MLTRQRQREVDAGQLHQIKGGWTDGVLDDQIGWRPHRDEHIDREHYGDRNGASDRTRPSFLSELFNDRFDIFQMIL